mmetsp:Transcript_36039/g.95696  ORF Transcript_36039/g.95696 Transcript_36039/m.95696 type:complete len:203 (-) Transcript_36039:2103-2711(-)
MTGRSTSRSNAWTLKSVLKRETENVRVNILTTRIGLLRTRIGRRTKISSTIRQFLVQLQPRYLQIQPFSSQGPSQRTVNTVHLAETGMTGGETGSNLAGRRSGTRRMATTAAKRIGRTGATGTGSTAVGRTGTTGVGNRGNGESTLPKIERRSGLVQGRRTTVPRCGTCLMRRWSRLQARVAWTSGRWATFAPTNERVRLAS